MSRGIALLILGLSVSGCINHHVTLSEDDPSWHHSIAGEALAISAAVTVPTETQTAVLEITSGTAGFLNRYHAYYGEMFLQVLEAELSQLFTSHTVSPQTPGAGSYGLHLDILDYSFVGLAAHVTLSAQLRDPSGAELLNRQYQASGFSGAGRVLLQGPRGMRSTVSESTLGAYLEIFEQLRTDLRSLLQDQQPDAESADAASGG